MQDLTPCPMIDYVPAHSPDYANHSAIDSTKIKWKRTLARAYVFVSEWQHKGDELFVVFEKPSQS